VKNVLANLDTKCFKCIPAMFNLGAVGLVSWSLVTVISCVISSIMTDRRNF